MKKWGQSLVEFVVVAPILVILIFSIIEFSMYWRAVNIVQEVAQNASTNVASIYVAENSSSNPAVDKTLLLITEKIKELGENINLEDKSDAAEVTSRPFSLYTYESKETRNTVDGIKPILTAIIDFRDPYKEGINVKLIYQYRTILVGAAIPIPGKKSLVIIPRDIKIINNKTQQYSSY